MQFTERPLPGPIPYTVNTPWRIVLHTTEGTSTTTYSNGAVAPQVTVWVQKRQAWRHYDYRRYAGKALKHPPGTPATNTTRAVQIEVIGFCDDHQIAHPLHISHWTDGDYDYLGSVIGQIADDVGCKVVSSVTWKGYGLGVIPNTSAGENNGVRMSDARWASYEGICGHQHVPNNVHGDPGNVNIAKILSGASMPTAAEVVDELFARRMTNPLDPSGNTTARFDTMFAQTYGQARTVVLALPGLVDDVAQAVFDKLPPAQVGGLTKQDVVDALTQVLVNGTGGTS